MKQKNFLTIDGLIANIKAKGLLIKDEASLKETFSHNNYYFITGYKEPFKDLSGNYKKMFILKIY